MTSKRSLLAAATIVAGSAFAPAARAGAARDSKALAAALSAPSVTEPFASAPAPCGGSPKSRTTLQQEGCAEQQVLRLDATINSLNKSVFALLSDDRAKQHFIAANGDWVAYRHADCVSMELYEEGSEGPVIYAQCLAARDTVRIKDLQTFKRALAAAG